MAPNIAMPGFELPAIQISRRSNRWNPDRDTAALKLARVLDWIRSLLSRVFTPRRIAAQFGRTSSPVAPVVIMCATLSRYRPMQLVSRVFLPLLCGAVVMLVAATLWR